MYFGRMSTKRESQHLRSHTGTEQEPEVFTLSSSDSIDVMAGHSVINVQDNGEMFTKAFIYVKRGATATINAPSNLRVSVEGGGNVVYRTDNAENGLTDYTAQGIEIVVG